MAAASLHFPVAHRRRRQPYAESRGQLVRGAGALHQRLTVEGYLVLWEMSWGQILGQSLMCRVCAVTDHHTDGLRPRETGLAPQVPAIGAQVSALGEMRQLGTGDKGIHPLSRTVDLALRSFEVQVFWG